MLRVETCLQKLCYSRHLSLHIIYWMILGRITQCTPLVLSWFVVFRKFKGFWCLLGLVAMWTTSLGSQVFCTVIQQQLTSQNLSTILAKYMKIIVFKNESHTIYGSVSRKTTSNWGVLWMSLTSFKYKILRITEVRHYQLNFDTQLMLKTTYFLEHLVRNIVVLFLLLVIS